MKGIFSTWNRAKKEKNKGYTEEFYHLHFIWKYRYFVPIIKIGEKLLKKILVKVIPHEEKYDYLREFDVAIEESIMKWAHYCRMDYNDRRSKAGKFTQWRTKDRNKEWEERFVQGSSAHIVRVIKDFVITMCVHDTAYNPLFKIITNEYLTRINYYKEEKRCR